MPTENHTTLTPDTPVRYLKGVGPKTAERFEKLGIVTLADLLCHYPRRYIDFTKPYSIAEAPTDVECVVRAEVFAKPGGRILPGGRRMERITAGDDVSSLEITWFNNPYAAQKLQLGQEYYFQGIVTGGMLRRQMVNPQVRTAEQIKASPFEAVYPQTEGLTSNAIAKCVRQLLPHAELLPDPLPPEMLAKYRLLSKADAVRAIHCPTTEEEAFAARRRLIYEELLVLQLGIGRMKNHGAASTGAPIARPSRRSPCASCFAGRDGSSTVPPQSRFSPVLPSYARGSTRLSFLWDSSAVFSRGGRHSRPPRFPTCFDAMGLSWS